MPEVASKRAPQVFAARAEYWERRHAELPPLIAVGHSVVGEQFNAWMYRVRRAVFRRTLGPVVAARPDLAVLDVGSGTGFYVDRWRELGVADVTASDIAPTALARLCERDPSLTVLALDIAGPAEQLPARRFDVVTAFDVLFHLVEDSDYERAVTNLARLVRPGGVLALSENLRPDRDQRVNAMQVDRAAARTRRLLELAGFEVVARRAMFVLMNDPQNATSALHRAWWAGLLRLLSAWPAAGALLGPPLYLVERALVARRTAGPSTDLLICRRR